MTEQQGTDLLARMAEVVTYQQAQGIALANIWHVAGAVLLGVLVVAFCAIVWGRH